MTFGSVLTQRLNKDVPIGTQNRQTVTIYDLVTLSYSTSQFHIGSVVTDGHLEAVKERGVEVCASLLHVAATLDNRFYQVAGHGLK